MMTRVVLFLLSNLAILVVISLLTSLFGVGNYLTSQGIDYQSLMIFALIVGFSGSAISLFLSKWMAKMAYSVRIFAHPQGAEEGFLLQSIQRLSATAGIRMPEVGIYESSEVNAFATGWNRNNALVAVSRGLLEQMDKKEIEGVLAHEIAHIANGDMVTMALLQGVLNTFVVFFARIAAYIVQSFFNRSNEDSESSVGGLTYMLTSIVFEIIFGILASILVMWFSRHREFRADAGSAKFLGSPQSMIAALKKLQALQNLPQDERGKQFAALKISDKPSFWNLFSSHPSLEKRIEALS